MASLIEDFFSGFLTFFQSFSDVFDARIRRYVVSPILISVVAFLVVFGLGGWAYHRLLAWLLAFLPHWLQWLKYILWIIFIVIFWTTMSYIFVYASNLFSLPFNGLLSIKTETMLGQKPGASMSSMALICDVPRLLGRQLKLLMYWLPKAILCLIIFFIPIIHIIAPILWFLFNAWMMSMQYMDYPMDNHEISFNDMRYRLAQKRGYFLGFGSAILLMSMIPIVNLFVMPAAVIAATKLYATL